VNFLPFPPRESFSFELEDIKTERQTYRQTDRQTERETINPKSTLLVFAPKIVQISLEGEKFIFTRKGRERGERGERERERERERELACQINDSGVTLWLLD